MKKRSTTPVLGRFKHKFSLGLSVLALLVFPVAVYANSYQNEIDNLDREISAKESVIKDLQKRANTLENRLQILAAEKDEIQTRINQSEAKKRKLEKDIQANERKMERQQTVLGKTFADLYVGASISPIEMLASSKNISEYIDQAEYQSSIRDNLQSSIEDIKQLRAKLAKQKQDVEAVIAQQKGQREQLAAKESEQSTILAQTRGEESSYRSMVSDLKKQRKEAEAALAASLATGNYRVANQGVIKAGDIVGGVGNTGMSTGPHLHLEVRVGGAVVDPTPYIQRQPVSQPPAWISQYFGNADPIYVSGSHPGVDYAAVTGTPISAIADGVLYRGCSTEMFGTYAYGYVAVVEHGNGVVSIYGHMDGPC